MASDIQEKVGQFLGSDSGRQLAATAVSELLGGFSANKATKKAKSLARDVGKNGSGPLSGAKGLAAGAGAAALAPVAVKGIGKLIKGGSLPSGPKDLAQGAASKVGDAVTGKVQEKVDDAGGPSGILKEGVKSLLPFGGDDDEDSGGKNDAQGVGKGRRMPIQQSVDIGLPIETVYNQWTQFEEWPKFMHRVKRVSQEDPCKVSFAVKIWGKTKEFTAEIETQRPNDRIKWKTTQGMTHTGVVVFRELGPNLTRVLLSFDLDPGGLLEKYARGARYVKRAARAELHRFVAFVEMLEHETGAWRGVIEEGEVVEDHDSSYDDEREYSSADELLGSDDDQDSDEDDSDDDDDEGRRSRGRNGGDPGQRRRSSGRSQSSRSSSRSSGRSTSGRSSSGRSSSGRSSSGRSSSGRSSSGGSSSGRSSSGGSSAKRGGSSGRSSGRSSTRSGGTSSRSRSSGSSGRSSGGSSGSRSRSSSGGGSSRGRSTGSSSGSRSRSSSGGGSGSRSRSSSGGGSGSRSRSTGSSSGSRSRSSNSSSKSRSRASSSRRS